MQLNACEEYESFVDISSSRLYIEPSINKGVARTFNIFGTLDYYNYSISTKEADAKAISRDWSMVGIDMLKAIICYEKGIFKKSRT